MLNEADEKAIKLLDWNKGKKPGPFRIEIHPTNVCNLKCIMCAAKFNRKVELPKKRLHRIIHEAADLKVKNINICGGGEPLFYRQGIFEIMKTAKLFGLEGSLTTNGTLFTQAQIKKLVEIGWDNVVFSLDSADDKTHDYIRGVKGTFKKCTEAIKLFEYWKKKLKRDKPEIKINTVITNKSYNKLEKIINLAQKINCFSISFHTLHITFKDAKKMELNKNEKTEFQKSLKKIRLVSQKLKVKTNINDFVTNPLIKKPEKLYEFLLSEPKNKIKNNLLSSPCFEPWTSMVVFPKGGIGPCPRITEQSKINIKNSTLRKIWYGKFFDKIRQDILNKKLSDYCENCCLPNVTCSIHIKKIIYSKNK